MINYEVRTEGTLSIQARFECRSAPLPTSLTSPLHTASTTSLKSPARKQGAGCSWAPRAAWRPHTRCTGPPSYKGGHREQRQSWASASAVLVKTSPVGTKGKPAPRGLNLYIRNLEIKTTGERPSSQRIITKTPARDRDCICKYY